MGISLDGDVLEEVVVDLYGVLAVVDFQGLAVDEFVEVRLLDLGQLPEAFPGAEVDDLDVVAEQFVVGVLVDGAVLALVLLILVDEVLERLVEVLVDALAHRRHLPLLLELQQQRQRVLLVLWGLLLVLGGALAVVVLLLLVVAALADGCELLAQLAVGPLVGRLVLHVDAVIVVDLVAAVFGGLHPAGRVGVLALVLQALALLDGPLVELEVPAVLLGLFDGEVFEEVDALELVAVEQYLEGPLEEGDPLEQVEHVDLLEHFLPALEVPLHCAPVAPAALLLEYPVDQLREEVEEVVLLEVGLLLVLLVEYGAEVDFEGVVVVDLDDEEAHGEGAEEPPDVGEDLVELDVAAFDVSGVGRLEDEEGAVVGVVGAHLVPVLDGVFADDAAGDLGVIGEGGDAVVGGDGVVLHHDLPLLAAGLGEDDVVGVLEVEGAELSDVGVDERVHEVDGEEDLLTAVGEVLVDQLVAGAVSGVGWVNAAVAALVYRYLYGVLDW